MNQGLEKQDPDSFGVEIFSLGKKTQLPQTTNMVHVTQFGGKK